MKELMEIRDWALDRIKPYPGNPRKRPKEAVQKVADSIRRFGWQQPIVVDEEGVILVGHTRRDAAELLGSPTAPVLQALGLSEADKKAYRIADNRTGEETDWDSKLLGVELAELSAMAFDMAGTGFDPKEMELYMAPSVRPDEDDIPPAPTPTSVLGDLWLLGDHRVLCGDSTRSEDVATLFGDRPAPNLMVTDPPYGVEYDPAWRDAAKAKVGHLGGKNVQVGVSRNDDRADWTETWKLFPGGVAYIWHAALHTAEVILSLRTANFETRAQIIWRKQSPVFSRGAYHWQHEPAWYAVRTGATANWQGDRKQTTVWDIPNLNPRGNSGEERFGHSAQKPVEAMRRPILNHTVPGDSVYDPFLGSGTTLIAAEIERRHCFGLELEPRYVDIIVARWEKHTGRKAKHAESGADFESVREGRLLGWQDSIKEEAINAGANS